MPVSASFEPQQIAATPGETAAFTLQLDNLSDDERVVKLRPGGGLAQQTMLQAETIYLDPNEHFEVPVVVDANSALPAGLHSCVIEIDDNGETLNAEASIEILEAASFTAELLPEQSRSPSVGKHRIAIVNAGNVPILVEATADEIEGATTELAVPAVSVDPGHTANVALQVKPTDRFWTGQAREHAVGATLAGSNGEQIRLTGSYLQGPRLRPWVVPALVGILGSILLFVLAWFLLLRPAIEDIAREEAAELDLLQQEILDDQIAQIEQAAEEASELPLGEPTDLRLEVEVAEGTSGSQGFDFNRSGTGRVLSITDVIFQNPTGATGTIELLRNDQVLLRSEMANFRDLSTHLVAPFRVDSGSTISLQVTCTAPGPGVSACEAAATIVGYVDDV